jgi:hypothetical protein
MKGGGFRKKRGDHFWRVLLDLHRGVEFCSREGLVQGAPVCWGFWEQGPDIHIDVGASLHVANQPASHLSTHAFKG